MDTSVKTNLMYICQKIELCSSSIKLLTIHVNEYVCIVLNYPWIFVILMVFVDWIYYALLIFKSWWINGQILEGCHVRNIRICSVIAWYLLKFRTNYVESYWKKTGKVCRLWVSIYDLIILTTLCGDVFDKFDRMWSYCKFISIVNIKLCIHSKILIENEKVLIASCI